MQTRHSRLHMTLQKLPAGTLGTGCQREKYHRARDGNKAPDKQSPGKLNRHAALYRIAYTGKTRNYHAEFLLIGDFSRRKIQSVSRSQFHQASTRMRAGDSLWSCHWRESNRSHFGVGQSLPSHVVVDAGGPNCRENRGHLRQVVFEPIVVMVIGDFPSGMRVEG